MAIGSKTIIVAIDSIKRKEIVSSPTIASHIHKNASNEFSGFMSPEDKIKLDLVKVGEKTDFTFYEHNQPSISNIWIINHNLGYRPIVEIFTFGGLQILADILHVSLNQVQINFASPIGGFARLI